MGVLRAWGPGGVGELRLVELVSAGQRFRQERAAVALAHLLQRAIAHLVGNGKEKGEMHENGVRGLGGG